MSYVLLTQDTGKILGPISKLLGYIMEGIFFVIDKIGIPNIGLAIIESEEIVNALNANDEILVDFDKGEILKLADNTRFQTTPFPPFIQEIINANGYLNYISERKKA